jgi:acetyl-CoA carboxylase carboxyl transferase subunit alpha
MSADPTQFEEPILRIRRRIEELSASEAEPAKEAELAELRQKLTKLSHEIYSNLTPWQKTLVARHPQRPYTLDFISLMIEEWSEIAGDRKFADDPAIVAGFGRFRGTACCVIGHQKGRNTKEKVIRNFGQPRPEGFRKAKRVMELAGRFGLPLVTFLDTAGAYPGIEDEERGQSWAISACLETLAHQPVPVVVVVLETVPVQARVQVTPLNSAASVSRMCAPTT